MENKLYFMSLWPQNAIERVSTTKKKGKLTFWRHFQTSVSPRILLIVGAIFHSLKAAHGSHYYVCNGPLKYVKNHNFSDTCIGLDWAAQIVQLQVKDIIIMLWQIENRWGPPVWSSWFIWIGCKCIVVSTRSHLAVFLVKFRPLKSSIPDMSDFPTICAFQKWNWWPMSLDPRERILRVLWKKKTAP